MVAEYVTRSEINPQRFMAVVTTPQGRPASIYVEPNQFKPGENEPAISLWISVEPFEKGDFDSEYEAACLEEEALDDRLTVIALGVSERLGASEEGVLEALREGLSLMAGRDLDLPGLVATLDDDGIRLPEIEQVLEETYAARVYEINEKTNQYMLF